MSEGWELGFGGGRAFIVGEVGLGHDGSLGMAHAYIEGIAKAGGNGVKFPCHIAEAESTYREGFRVRQEWGQDLTRHDYWRRTEFDRYEWKGLRFHANKAGLRFIASPFSVEAVQLLLWAGVEVFKVASGEIANIPMLKAIKESGLPVIISTGMSDWPEIQQCVAEIKPNSHVLLQCVSEYPCPPEHVGLNNLYRMKEIGQLVGLSDHSGTIWPGVAAASMGLLDALEVHVVFSKDQYGPDVSSSLTFEDFRLLVEGIRYVEQMKEHPTDKGEQACRFQPMRDLFTHSLVASHTLEVGTIIGVKDLAYRKPGTGLKWAEADSLIGKTVSTRVERNNEITWEQVGGKSGL